MEQSSTTGETGPALAPGALALELRFALAEDLQVADRAVHMAAARRLELVEAFRVACGGPSASDGVKFRVQHDLDWRSLRAEVATAINVTERVAEQLLNTAWALHDHLPGTLALFREGSISERHAHTMARHTDGLTPEQITKLETEALKVAARVNPARFEVRVRMLRQKLTAEHAAERHQAAAEKRYVSLEYTDDQMAFLTAYMPAVEATAIMNRLHHAAKTLQTSPGEGDAGAATGADAAQPTRAQLVTDVFTELLLNGTTDGTGAGIVPTVNLVVPVLTLLGQSTEPAFVEGVGPIDLDTARRLTAEAPSFTRILTHPETGAVLSIGRTKYRATTVMRDWLRTRDGTCRHPGCGQPAARCDLDHTTDWAHGGTTDQNNLAHLCRAHHTLKHNTTWTVRPGPAPGDLEWTSPIGLKYSTEPILRTSTTTPEPARVVPNMPDPVGLAELERLPPEPDRDWYETEWAKIVLAEYTHAA